MNIERAFEAAVGALMLYFIAKIIKESIRKGAKMCIWPIAATVIFIYAAFNHNRWYHEVR